MYEIAIKLGGITCRGGRRTGIDRREFSYTAFAPERRDGWDRRIEKERRKEPRILIEEGQCDEKTGPE